MITIKLPLTKEQFEQNLRFVSQCTRQASLPAESHETVIAVLNDLLAGIQPEELPKKPKPEEVIKAKQREKAKAGEKPKA